MFCENDVIWYARVRDENKFNINSPPFCQNKKKSSEAEWSNSSPLDNTPPKWSAKLGDMDFEPTIKELVGSRDNAIFMLPLNITPLNGVSRKGYMNYNPTKEG